MPTSPTPIAFTEDEYQVVMAAAVPIHPHQRHDFLAALADELGRHETRGVGLVHRYAAEAAAALRRGGAQRNVAQRRTGSRRPPPYARI